jgi:hypothetical protein
MRKLQAVGLDWVTSVTLNSKIPSVAWFSQFNSQGRLRYGFLGHGWIKLIKPTSWAWLGNMCVGQNPALGEVNLGAGWNRNAWNVLGGVTFLACWIESKKCWFKLVISSCYSGWNPCLGCSHPLNLTWNLKHIVPKMIYIIIEYCPSGGFHV